jgi:hypothetical protein
MANPPPPYDDITGISRTVMKDNAQETLVNYNGNARPGEIVVDLTTNPPTPYIGNNVGQLTLLTSAGAYGNIQVGQYLEAGQVGNIIPSGNAVYTLGNATNQWSDLYVSNATIYLNNIPVGLTSANVLTVNGNAVLSNNSNVAITTTGNIAANYFIGNGSLLTGISGSGNTGNVTFNNVNIIGTGNLNLQPDSGNSEYLNIYLTLADDIHIAGTGNVILGTDEQANIAVLSDGNVTIQAGNVGGTNTWAFGTAGNLTLPRGGVVYETNIPDGGLNGNTIALTPSGGTNADQQLLIYPTTNDANHLHLTSGNLYNTELFLGDDNLYVKLANTGNIVVNSNDDNGNTAQWTFGTDDSLTLPKNSIISETTPATGAAASINVNQSASSIPNGLFVSLPPATVSNYNVPGTDIIVTVTWVANGPSYYAPRFAVVDGGTGHTPGGQFGGGEVLTVPYIDMGITGGGNWTWYVETIASNLILEAGLNSWTFSGDGNLTDPGGMIISGNINTLGTQTALLQPTNNLPLSFISSGANGSVTSYWAEDFGNLMTSNIAAIYTPLQGSQTVRIVTGTNGGNIAIYDFDPDGMFTTAQISATGNVYAGNVSASGNVTGAYILGNGSGLTSLPAPTVTQDIISNGAMSIMLYDGNIKYNNYATVEPSSGNITGGNISASGNITGNYIFGNGSQLTGITANTGNVTFSNQIVLGTGTNDGGGGLYLAPGTDSIANSAVQYLRVRGGDYPTHIHLDTGNNAYYDQYFGADTKYVKLEANGNIVINADDGANSATWTFDNTGNLTIPGGMIINGNTNTLGSQTALLQPTDDLPLAFISSGANGSVISYWAEDVANLMTSNIAAIYTPLQNTQTVRIVTGTNGGNIAIYDFDKDGVFSTAQVSATGNITANYFSGNGSLLTGITASVPSQTILPTIQTITVEARPAGLFGGGQGGANVTVANTIPVTEYGVIITDGTVSEKYKTGSLGSIPGTVSLTFTTGLNSAQFTVFAYVTSNAGTYYSNSATGTSGICLLAGTQIALSDGTYKAIEHITYTDRMLSWDFDRGCYAETTAMWIKRGETGSQYNLLTFSDGTTLRTFDQHRIFNKQAGAFTYPMTDATPIGTVTVNEHGQEITLTNKQVIVDTIEYYNVITDHHMNLFSDSVLTSCRFNNIYPITDMKFVKDGRKLRTRDEFENIPDRFFYGLRLAEQTTDIETVEWYVNRLLRTEVSTKSELTV